MADENIDKTLDILLITTLIQNTAEPSFGKDTLTRVVYIKPYPIIPMNVKISVNI